MRLVLRLVLHPEADWVHKTVSPFIDTIIVTIATIALARPNYPIWIGYLLIVSSLSAVAVFSRNPSPSPLLSISPWVTVCAAV